MKNLINDFINYQSNVLWRKEMVSRYICHLRRLYKYLVRVKWLEFKLEDIKLQDIIDFISEVKTTPITAWWNKYWKYITKNSLHGWIVSIRMFFKYVSILWYKLWFNREQIPIFRMEEKKRSPMENEDYELLRQAPILYEEDSLIAQRNQLLIDIPRETGLRRCEIVRCKFKDFHNSNRQFRIEWKWGSFWLVFFSVELQRKVLRYEQNLIRRFHKSFTYVIWPVWTYNNEDKQLNPNIAWNIVRNYVKRLKADWLLDSKKKLSLHMERHSFAMKCVKSWLSQQATTEIMRHKDPKTTLQYYHLESSRLLNQYDLIKK